MKQLVLARARTSIRLGQELGRGGEGAVFAVEGQADRVAKIYSAAPDSRKVQKLTAMSETATPALLRIASWPLDLLTDGKGTVQGFVMPRLQARRDIHELYSPKSRTEAFPEADFRFLVHAGANIARAFGLIHEHGHVIGDVNHGNLLVGPDGTVMLIDCDSFQIRNGTQVFTCDVGVPLFTAPELQGKAFRELVRTANHDRFGLAVLLFHLLYMGRHPFAGRYSGPGDMPIEKAIAEHRFAYGPDRAASGMERPPGTLPLETMGASISQLFVRTFGVPGRPGSGERPDAKAWIDALETLKRNLRACPAASWHHYPGELQRCPWCEIESRTAVRLFGQRIVAHGPTGAVDLATLWNAIVAVPDPGADPPLPSERPWSPPPGVDLPSPALKYARIALSLMFACAGVAACAGSEDGGFGVMAIAYGFALFLWPWVPDNKRAEVDRAWSAANAEWENALARWRREASLQAFEEKRKSLEQARAELADLPNERRRRMAKLEAERESRQRQRYLDRFRIDRAKIRNIGSGRASMLASYGIETAADVDGETILKIPGFGPMLTGELVQWRRSHERNFRFNPSEPVNRRDVDAIDRELESRRQALMSALRQGPDTLRRLSQELTAARPRLMPVLESAWTARKIAEVRREAL